MTRAIPYYIKQKRAEEIKKDSTGRAKKKKNHRAVPRLLDAETIRARAL
jgi:hypothetical protein